MIQNARLFGIPVVVAVNRFKDDTPAEIELVRKIGDRGGRRGRRDGESLGARAAPARSNWAKP